MRTSVDVANYLTEREVPHELFPLRGRFRTAERLAALLDLPMAEVGKVVLFEGTDAAVAAVVPAGFGADVGKVRRAAGASDLEPSSTDRASELTEYLPEAIPPAGLPSGVEVIIDRSLQRDAVLYFPGGEVRSILKIRGLDLVRATGAKVASIATRHPAS